MPNDKKSTPAAPAGHVPGRKRVPRTGGEFYQTFLDRSSDAVLLHDTNGNFLGVNEEFCRQVGYNRDELLAMTPLHINIQSETASVLEQLETLRRQGRTCCETFLVHRDGRLLHTRITRRIITLHGQQVVVSIARNDTPAEKNSSTDHCHRILSATEDLIAFLDSDLVYRKVNQAYCRAYNRSADQIIGTAARTLHHGGEFDRHLEALLKTCLAGEIVRRQVWGDYPALGRRLMDLTGYPFCDHGSDVISGVVLIAHDITELHASGQISISRERQWLERILGNMPVGVYIVDRLFNLRYVNPAIQEQFGPLPEETKKCHHYLQDRSSPCPWCEAEKVFADGRPSRWSWQRRDTGDISTTYEVLAAPMTDGSDTPAMITLLYDVTERQLAQEKLEILNEQLTTLINAFPDGIVFKDGSGRWLLANGAGLRIFGLEDVEYFGKTDRELARHTSLSRKVLLASEKSDELAWQQEEVSRFDTVLPLPDGGARTYELVKAPLFHEDGSRKALIVLSRDISKWVETEQALRMEMEKRKEANISMRVLLDQYREARQEVEQQITSQLKKLVFPYLDFLEQTVSHEQARECLKIINSHLASITDPFAKRLSDPFLGLTPREILVADLVRQGKSTEAIARALNLSKRTIDAYRISLRKKLRLTNKKVNLREYLRSVYSLND